MLVTISGPPGSGTSSAAAGLATELGYEHVSGGDLFRELAAEEGMTVEEFNKQAETDDRIDRELDKRLREVAVEREGVVLESRLAGWMAGNHADLRFWLDAPREVRTSRIASREAWSLQEATDRTEMREESERRRYADYYDIDFTDLRIYDLSINTARWEAGTVVALLTQAVETYDREADEGQLAVTGVQYDFG